MSTLCTSGSARPPWRRRRLALRSELAPSQCSGVAAQQGIFVTSRRRDGGADGDTATLVHTAASGGTDRGMQARGRQPQQRGRRLNTQVKWSHENWAHGMCGIHQERHMGQRAGAPPQMGWFMKRFELSAREWTRLGGCEGLRRPGTRLQPAWAPQCPLKLPARDMPLLRRGGRCSPLSPLRGAWLLLSLGAKQLPLEAAAWLAAPLPGDGATAHVSSLPLLSEAAGAAGSCGGRKEASREARLLGSEAGAAGGAPAAPSSSSAGGGCSRGPSRSAAGTGGSLLPGSCARKERSMRAPSHTSCQRSCMRPSRPRSGESTGGTWTGRGRERGGAAMCGPSDVCVRALLQGAHRCRHGCPRMQEGVPERKHLLFRGPLPVWHSRAPGPPADQRRGARRAPRRPSAPAPRNRQRRCSWSAARCTRPPARAPAPAPRKAVGQVGVWCRRCALRCARLPANHSSPLPYPPTPRCSGAPGARAPRPAGGAAPQCAAWEGSQARAPARGAAAQGQPACPHPCGP